MREYHYANPCSTEKFLRFQVTRLRITLLIFQYVLDRLSLSDYKFSDFFSIRCHSVPQIFGNSAKKNRIKYN